MSKRIRHTRIRPASIAIAGLVAVFAALGVLALPAGAGSYGKRLDYDKASGSWTDTPSAAVNGGVDNPNSFTVVSKGQPKPSSFCTSERACKVVTTSWRVACTKHGKSKLKSGTVNKHKRKTVVKPKMPFHDPDHCTISASAALAYYAGGSISVAVYYR